MSAAGARAVPRQQPEEPVAKRRKRRRLEIKLLQPGRAERVGVDFTKYLLFPGPGQKSFIFVLQAEKAILSGRGRLEQAVAALQRAVGSAASAFVIVEPGMELQVYEVVDPRQPGG